MPSRYAARVLELSRDDVEQMVAHCLHALPHEGCGLLVGETASGRVVTVVGARNAAASALVYELDGADYLAADRAAAASGHDVIGAFHSHTHTDAWPSATDVAAAVDPSWHWVIVSLRHASPVIRSFSIVQGAITEEDVHVA